MILPNLLFDIVVFGLMAVAVAVDALMPVTCGAATLLVLGFLVFLTSEDAGYLARKTGWGQESYASGISVSVAGFIYFWWRNSSDTAATALHICLMLSALMVLIGFVASFGAAIKERSSRPIGGLVVTTLIAVVLGAAGGLGILFWTSPAVLPLKLGVVAVAFAIGRGISRSRPPVAASGDPDIAAHDAPAPRVLRPSGGTTLDHALPLILLGALAALIAR